MIPPPKLKTPIVIPTPSPMLRVLAFPDLLAGAVCVAALTFLIHVSCVSKVEVARVNILWELAEVMLDATLVEMTVGAEAELVVVATVTELDVCGELMKNAALMKPPLCWAVALPLGSTTRNTYVSEALFDIG